MDKLRLTLGNTNLVDYSTWSGLTSGDIGYWNDYTVGGLVNSRIEAIGPFGNNIVLWQASGGSGSFYGGWNMLDGQFQYIPVDNTKNYRFSVWVNRKIYNTTKPGDSYFGLWATSGTTRQNITNKLTGDSTNNPYGIIISSFISNTHLPQNTWRLLTFTLWNKNTLTGGTLSSDTGLWYINGTRITGTSAGIYTYDFIMSSLITGITHRLAIPSNSSGATIYLAYPRIDCIDGTEPSIDMLLRGEEFDRVILKDVSQNLLDTSSWIDGTTGSTSGIVSYEALQTYPANNYRAIDTDPFGNNAVVWVAAGETSGTSAGIQSTNGAAGILIDNTKTYRFSIWSRRLTEGIYINNRYYFGYNPRKSNAGADYSIRRSDGLAGTNFYFVNGAQLPTYFPLNEWRLAVGYLLPAGTLTGSKDSNYFHKLYNLTGGTLYTQSENYVMSGSTTGLHMRCAMPYQSTAVMQSVYPRIDCVDGTEPSLDDLLNDFTHKKRLLLSPVITHYLYRPYICVSVTNCIDNGDPEETYTLSTNRVLETNKYYYNGTSLIKISSAGSAGGTYMELVGPYDDCTASCSTTTTTAPITTTTTYGGPSTTTTTTLACNAVALHYYKFDGPTSCSASQTVYRLNAPSLATASKIYSDAGCTTYAATGYYSDGVIYRYWLYTGTSGSTFTSSGFCESPD